MFYPLQRSQSESSGRSPQQQGLFNLTCAWAMACLNQLPTSLAILEGSDEFTERRVMKSGCSHWFP